MANNLTAGDDYTAPCPSCGKRMDIGYLTRANNLHPGVIGTCSCGSEFQVDKIDYIPVVWLRRKTDDPNYEADVGS